MDVLAGLIQTYVQKRKILIQGMQNSRFMVDIQLLFVYATLYILSVFVGPLTGIILKEISGFSGYIAL
jgi:hypothetical protein